ncbi:hypothetical protein BjapCC829_23740 [Bradyrhizobium barranii]|uniref:Uncharacterized protein n=1 Tax=Bradyrhizobium barranii TaxID=2992140 RepID=A0ABY3QAT5_9BRAD|nr:hypothetical protein [Bradyrhizobium japonicum]UFW83001.1 hypothetical protein BjapCC829_23740 [Bradyrhizobium japonicum]
MFQALVQLVAVLGSMLTAFLGFDAGANSRVAGAYFGVASVSIFLVVWFGLCALAGWPLGASVGANMAKIAMVGLPVSVGFAFIGWLIEENTVGSKRFGWLFNLVFGVIWGATFFVAGAAFPQLLSWFQK